MNLPDRTCWASVKTPLGCIGLIASPRGIARVWFHPPPARASARARDPEALASWLAALRRALDGEPMDFSDWPLDWGGATRFQRRVWAVTRRIPWGQTRPYCWVAARAGDPRAARAVGQALAANPVPLVVPCHRVLRSDGGLGGFGGGLDLKRRLLKNEGVTDV
jgi:methylated-DNA-[protein]-cysteine S-methyltransferase